ncbi:MAG: polysaccharide pyruvyl transferase family protein [Bacteroidota bacterium]|nr:polysaccharide pyruvyl transferase family protein [Bacteroidota bacterium]
MKIALISFHDAINFGAALQAYALQHALEHMGHESEYINYVNPARQHQYDMPFLFWEAFKKRQFTSAIKYLVGAPFLFLRKKKFKSFNKQYLKTTKKVFRSSEEAASLNSSYDRFIVGSDQVWNPVNNGNDTAYLLDFVKEKRKKISYSSSFGLSELDKETESKYRRCFDSFHALAVREEIGQKIVSRLIGRTPELVLDPVMLLSGEDWRTMAIDQKSSSEEYVFTYTNREQQISAFMRTGYNMAGKKMYKLSRYTRPRDFLNPSVRVKYWMSPMEFVKVISGAELVVSASFHCIAMAILLNKPFVAILTGNYGKDERLNNMLKMFNLENRALTDNMTEKDILSPIDWTFVNNEISSRRELSLKYLKDAIG